MLRWIRPPADTTDGASRARSAARGGAAADRVLDRPDRGLWAVADPVGSHAAGAIAAAATIDALAVRADAGQIDPRGICAILARIDRALRAARFDPVRTTGTSVVVLHLDRGIATLAWAGDCRAYRRRGDVLELLTRDHSVVHELVDAGALDPACTAGRTHVVARAIGGATAVEIETIVVRTEPGDVLLLCSRGLAARIPVAMIARRLRAPVAQAADALIEAAYGAEPGADVAMIAIEPFADTRVAAAPRSPITVAMLPQVLGRV